MADGDRPIVVSEGKFLRFMKQGRWEYVTRRGVSGVVAVIAITSQGNLLLVEQHRTAVDNRVIELPAGLAGDGKFRHETLEAAARRELLEETGYEAAAMAYVGGGPASAGLTDELVSIFLARDVNKVGPATGDGDEQITVHEVPITQLMPWLETQSQNGFLIDLKVYTAPCFLAAIK